MPTVVITGAAKGIGRATALRLDAKGYTVFAGVRSAADGEALRKAASPRLTPLLLDITDAAQIAAAAETLRAATGDAGLDGLVNNAGIAVSAPLEFMPIAEFRHQIEVNLTAQLAVTQAFIPLLRRAKGRIVNISSVGGRIAGPMLGPYYASKFALEALTDTLRQELAPWGIRLVSIEPGAIATPIWETGAATAARLLSQMPPEAGEWYAKPAAAARAFAEKAAKSGLPPERVAGIIEKSLSAARPQTRYIVGLDAQIGTRIIAHLPGRLRDWVMARR